MVGRPAEGRSDDFVKFDERCIIRPIFQGSVWVGLPSAGLYLYWTIFGKTVGRPPGRSAGRDGAREFSKSTERLPIAIVVGADALGAKLFSLVRGCERGCGPGAWETMSTMSPLSCAAP